MMSVVSSMKIVVINNASLLIFFFFSLLSDRLLHADKTREGNKMRDGCWICRKWEEHFYWDHFEESSFRFVKVMEGDFTQKMEFPQKFSRSFRIELIDVVALEAPGGKLWEIGLCKEEDRLYFNGGWKNFIEANEIEEDYILVFEYAGDSRFLVRIFDTTGCGRAASNLTDDDAGAKQKKAVDQTQQNFQNCHPSRCACKDHPTSHEQAADCRPASTARCVEDEKHGICKVKEDGRIGSSRICKKEFSELQSYSKSERKINVTNSQDTMKLLELKFASKEGNCSFVKFITQTNISTFPFMAIPTKFANKHIPQKPYVITVCNESSKKWYVNCSWRSSSWGFCGKSLFRLVRENKLQKGDACVFELEEDGKRVVMEMRIVRAEEVRSVLKKSYF